MKKLQFTSLKSGLVNTCSYSISITLPFKNFTLGSKFLKQKRTLLWQKNRNAKNLKIKFQQRRGKPKCSLDKNTEILPILYQFHHQNLDVGMYFY